MSEIKHEQWSSGTVFLLAAIGSAVGLGNIWKFPYMVGSNGGSAFILIYLAAVLGIIVPIVIAELMIGRRGQRSAINTMRHVAEQEGASRNWVFAGWLGVLIAYIVLTYFSLIAGWALAYVALAVHGTFSGINAQDSQAIFDGLIAEPTTLILWNFLFMTITAAIVSRGIHRGIESAVKWLMPMLFAILIVLVFYGIAVGDFAQTWRFMFSADFENLNSETLIMALGQAFLSNSVAMSIMMTYGAYTKRNLSLGKSALIITGADTAVALIAGLAIFPIVFASGLQASEGPGLIFVTLPIAFGSMPLGYFLGILFFLLLVFAALTSTISLLEPSVSWLVEHKGFKRPTVSYVAAGVSFALGILLMFSFNIWDTAYPLGMFERFREMTLFDLTDYITGSFLLPLSGLLITVFAGWVISKKAARDELQFRSPHLFSIWYYTVRYLAPIALILILLFG